MANNYDEAIKKNRQYLTQAQIDALVAAEKQFNIQNAGNRAGALASAREQYDVGYRGLQNMGLAGASGAAPTSGEVPRLEQQIRTPFEDYNNRLRDVERQRLGALGNQFAQQTQAQWAAEAERQRQAQEAAARARAAAAAVGVNTKFAAAIQGVEDAARQAQINAINARGMKQTAQVKQQAFDNGIGSLLSPAEKAQRDGMLRTARPQDVAAAAAFNIAHYAQTTVAERANADQERGIKLTEKLKGNVDSSNANRYYAGPNDTTFSQSEADAEYKSAQQALDNLKLKQHYGGKVSAEEMSSAQNAADIAKVKAEDPEYYSAINTVNSTTATPDAKRKANMVIADRSTTEAVNAMGYKSTMSSAQFDNASKVIPDLRMQLNIIDSTRNRMSNGGTGGQKTIDEAIAELEKHGYTEQEARELVKQFDDERYFRREYDYLNNAYTALFEHQGEKPEKPLNSKEMNPTYWAVNGNVDPEGKTLRNIGKSSTKAIAMRVEEFMTQEQRDAYNAIYEKDGIKAANAYAQAIKPFLEMQAAEADRKYFEEFASDENWLKRFQAWAFVRGSNLLGSVPAMAEKLIVNGQNIVQEGKTNGTGVLKKYSPDSNISRMSNWADIVQTKQSQDILEKYDKQNRPGMGKFVNFMYNTGTSMADSMIAMGVSGALGSWATDILFMSNAGNQAYKDAINRGATQEQAMGLAFLSGTAEALFEHISLDRLTKTLSFKGKPLIQALKETPIQTFVEGSEEFFTEFANILSDFAIMKGKSEMQQAIDNGELGRFLWDRLSSAAVGGFASGFLFGLAGVGGTALSQAKDSKAKSSLGSKVRENSSVQQVKNTAILLGGEAMQQAEKVQKRETDANVGEMTAIVLNEIQSLGKELNQDQQVGLTRVLDGSEMTVEEAKDVHELLGKETLEKFSYDAATPEAFQKSYNDRLQAHNVTSREETMQKASEERFAKTKQDAAARVWKDPDIGYTITKDGQRIKNMPGNLTAVSLDEQQKNNFAARTTAKAGRTTYQIAGMEAREGLTDEQKISALKKNMDRKQVARAEFIETLADALHVDMVIHDDINGANGYVDSDGTIHFSLSSKQSVLRVASHELTHKIREVSEEHFTAIKDAIIKQVGTDTFNKKVEQKKEEYRKAGVKLNQNLAIEETVTEYSEKMLQNTDFLEDFVEENPEAAKTLKGELLKILNAVKRAFKRAENRNYGGSWSNDIKYTQETLQAMYDGLEAVMEHAQNPEKTAKKAEAKSKTVQEETTAQKTAEADDLYMGAEDRQAEQAKKEALESGEKKTHVPGYKSSEVESVISAGMYGDKANYEGSDYETARGMIAQTIPEITAALEGKADAMDAYDKVRAAVGAMLDNYFEDEGDMTDLRESIPSVIGVDNTAKGDLKYSDQSLFQMSAKLSKALGKRVTLVGETNAKGQKNASYKTAEKLEEVWERVRDQFGLSDDQDFSIDTTKLLDFIQQRADTRKSFSDLYGSQRQEIIEYQSMAIMDAVKDMYEQKTGKKFSMDTDTLRQSMQKHNISAEIISAVETVQELNRKSVNTFSSEEIKKTEPFAREWYAQMKEKSPFFRAWFGEWRAHDKTPVVKVTADTKKEYKSGKIKNLDANRLISWGLQVKGETKIKYGPGSYAFDYLGNIEEIAKNAVLFETKTSKPDANSKMDYTAFMHSFYAVVENENGYVSVVKLLAEEAISKKGIDFTRAYELQEIREVAVLHPSVLSAGSSKGLTRQSATIKNVSDLYEYVKTNDKSLKPGREVDPAFLNDDGTPKVFYHGTDATFDAFDRTKGRANMDIQGMFFSPYEIEAEGYGSNVGQYYLSIHNPASEDVAFKALNMFKGQNNAGVKAREYLESKGYDGVVGYDEVIAFQPTQIKSATDNIGTFNKYDERYRYSLDTDAIRDAFTIIDTEGIEDGLEALKGVTPGKGLWALKDISRFLDSVSGGDKNLRNTLHAIFEAPHSDATGRYARNVARMQRKVLGIASRAGVCDENGKHFDSKKSAAIQNIGEGFSNTYTNLKYKVLDAEHVTVQAYDPDTKKLVVSEKDYTLDELRHDYGSNVADYVWDQAYRQAEDAQAAGGAKAWQEQMVNTRPYTLADLQKAFPDDWQKLERAATEFRQMYDDYIRDQNNMLATIYPIESEYESVDKLTEGIEAKEQRLEKMRAETERRVAKLEERIEAKKTASENRVAELEKKLTAKEKEMAGKRRTDTKAFRDLQDQAFRIQADIENEKADIAEYQAGVNAKIGAIRDQFKEYEKNAKDELKKMNQAKAETENAISHGEGDSLKRMHRLQYRSDYFHHFTELMSGVQNLKAIFKDNTDISPAIVGKSGNTRAKTKWAGYFQERKGDDYTADAINGMLKYGQLAEYKLAFDPLTAYLREVEKKVRALGDETNRDNLLRYIGEWTNAIMGKSHTLDRALIDSGLGMRSKLFKTLDWINSRVIQNTLLFNMRSALIQGSNLTNAKGIVRNNMDWANGLRCWALAAKGDEAMASIMAQSNFLASRYMDNLQLTDNKLKKTKEFAGWMLGALDEVSAKATWWAAYTQYTRNPNAKSIQRMGRTYESAVDYADDVTRRTHAGRGIGELAPAMTSRVINLVAPFQVEVNNTWQLLKDNVKQKNYLGLLSTGLSVFLFNTFFEAIVGSTPLGFDFIRAIVDICFGFAGDDPDDEDDNYGVKEIGQRLAGELAGGLPFAGPIVGFVGQDFAKKILGEDTDVTRYGNTQIGIGAVTNTVEGLADIGKAIANKRNLITQTNFISDIDDLANLVLPFGGKQLARTFEGVKTVAQGYGSKVNTKGEEQVQFMTGQNILDYLHAGLFGKWALTEASEYFGEKRLLPQVFGAYNGPKSSMGKPVDAKEYKAALQTGIDGRQYFSLKYDLRIYTKQEAKRAEMMEQPFTTEQKAQLDALLIPTAEAKAKGAVVYQKTSDGEWAVKADYTSKEWMDVAELGDKKYNQAKESGVNPKTFLEICEKWKGMSGKDKKEQARAYLQSLNLSKKEYDYIWTQVFNYKAE